MNIEDRPKVLLVEDDADMRAYLREHLTPQYELLEAAEGDAGWRLVQEEIPDVVVSDIVMPGLDGYALCRAVKSDPETDFIPVILLTARADARSKLAGLEGGADDYLAKPFDPDELRLRLRNLLCARARLRAHLAAEATIAELEPIPLTVRADDSPFVRRFQTVLAKESRAPSFDVETLAGKLGMSRSHLHRRVTEVFGIAPSEVLMSFRLERAARMLVRGTGNVGEIGYAVGFKDLSHFVRRFRARYGQTPAAYAAARRA